MMKLQSIQQGFTLVEVVIGLILTGIVGSAAIVYMGNNVSLYSELEAKSELYNEAHTALNLVGEDVRLAAVADANNRLADANAPSPSNAFSWASDSDTLVLATVVIDTSDEILFEDPTNYIPYKNNTIYYIEGSSLKKRTLAANVPNNDTVTSCPEASATPSCPSDPVLLDNVTNFLIRYLSADDTEVSPDQARSIELHVELFEERYGRDIDVEYTTRTVFRND